MIDRLPDVLLVLASALALWQVALVAIVASNGGTKSLWPGIVATVLFVVWVLVR